MSTYALAIPESYAPRPATYGTRAQLAAAGGGDVEGYLALAGCDKRAGTASYALRIVNQSAHALRARMTCATLRGESILAYPLDVHVAPFSIAETLLPIRVADVGPYDRAIVQIEGGDIAFSLEAPAPVRMTRRSGWAITAAAAAVFTLSAGLAAATASPRLSLLAAPGRTFAGSSIDIPYAFGGWASMEYALQTRDGRQLAAGLTGAHEGSLHFSVPPSAGSDVVLSVNVAGPFGRAARTERIAIAPPTPARKSASTSSATPQINAFAVSASRVRAGDTIVAHYITNAREGEVWLIDQDGQLWAREMMSSDGTTVLTVPQAAAGRQMRVVFHARNAGADAIAGAAVTILPGATAAQSAKAASSSASTLVLSAQSVAPGQDFTVSVNGPHSDASVALTDSKGVQVEEGDIPAGQDSVTLTAPSTQAAATYYVTANVSQGLGQQTLVRKLTVTPDSAGIP